MKYIRRHPLMANPCPLGNPFIPGPISPLQLHTQPQDKHA